MATDEPDLDYVATTAQVLAEEEAAGCAVTGLAEDFSKAGGKPAQAALSFYSHIIIFSHYLRRTNNGRL